MLLPDLLSLVPCGPLYCYYPFCSVRSIPGHPIFCAASWTPAASVEVLFFLCPNLISYPCLLVPSLCWDKKCAFARVAQDKFGFLLGIFWGDLVLCGYFWGLKRFEGARGDSQCAPLLELFLVMAGHCLSIMLPRRTYVTPGSHSWCSSVVLPYVDCC